MLQLRTTKRFSFGCLILYYRSVFCYCVLVFLLPFHHTENNQIRLGQTIKRSGLHDLISFFFMRNTRQIHPIQQTDTRKKVRSENVAQINFRCS